MFSVQVLLAVVVPVIVSATHSTTNLEKDSMLVIEEVSSSANTNNEIAFTEIVNGAVLNASIPATTTKLPTTIDAMNTTTTSKPLQVLKRGKRYLDFLKTSRMFFRVNVRNNIIARPAIWANGYGFRCNFPIENNRNVRPFRRDTYEALGELMDKSGFDGEACILKAYCTAHMDEDIDMNKGMLFKLFKYILILNDEDKRHFPYLNHHNCQQILHSHCPLSFNNLSPYTDDV